MKNERIGSGDFPTIDGFTGGSDDFYVQRQNIVLDSEHPNEQRRKLNQITDDVTSVDTD